MFASERRRLAGMFPRSTRSAETATLRRCFRVTPVTARIEAPVETRRVVENIPGDGGLKPSSRF